MAVASRGGCPGPHFRLGLAQSQELRLSTAQQRTRIFMYVCLGRRRVRVRL